MCVLPFQFPLRTSSILLGIAKINGHTVKAGACSKSCPLANVPGTSCFVRSNKVPSNDGHQKFASSGRCRLDCTMCAKMRSSGQAQRRVPIVRQVGLDGHVRFATSGHCLSWCPGCAKGTGDSPPATPSPSSSQTSSVLTDPDALGESQSGFWTSGGHIPEPNDQE